MEKAHQESYEGHKITVYYEDDDYFNPRTYVDNVSKIICVEQTRYIIGDDVKINFQSLDDIMEYIDEQNPLVVKPVYVYEHGGVTISTEPFSCRWDSGQIGYAFVTKESMKRMGFKDDDINTKKASEIIDMEIEEYDHYLKGEVYRWEIDYSGDYDSCGGYIGNLDDCIKDARGAINCHINANKNARNKIPECAWEMVAEVNIRYVCPYCNDVFDDSKGLIEHMKEAHAQAVLNEINRIS